MEAVRQRINLLDTCIDKVSFEEASRRIKDYIGAGVPRQIVTVNLDFLRLSSLDRSFQEIINTSAMAVPDGMPLIWASNITGKSLPERVAGVDLVSECAHLAADHGYRLFLLGAGPGVADKAAGVLRERYPGLCIAGTYSPSSLSDEADAETLEIIREARPHILLVAFGAPKQEKWIRKHMHQLDVPVLMGVGGSFDMLSGRVQRAPDWMQRTGMEWFYRFVSEPGRLWKRYFVHGLPIFLRLVEQARTEPVRYLAEPVLGPETLQIVERASSVA